MKKFPRLAMSNGLIRKMIVPAVVLACMAASAQVTVSASDDPPASREDVLKLFDVMQTRQQMVQIMKQVTLQMRTMSHEQLRKDNPKISDEELARIDARSEQIINSMPLADILDDMVAVYQKHLTKGDVDAMIAFYSSPTGQKILREMPAMTAEGMQASQPRMRKIMEDTMRKAQESDKPGGTTKN